MQDTPSTTESFLAAVDQLTEGNGQVTAHTSSVSAAEWGNDTTDGFLNAVDTLTEGQDQVTAHTASVSPEEWSTTPTPAS